MKKILMIIGFILLILGVFALESALAMWLFNAVICAFLPLEPISFWIGCGLILMINFAIGLFRKYPNAV